MSTEDGPGLRTTLFLKGCSLRCVWCHNPESISPVPQLRWTASRCLDCGGCLTVCPRGALSRGEGSAGGAPEIRIDRAACDACGICVEACPAGALEFWGYSTDSETAARELQRDRAFFGIDGGVTVSGGEACLQAPFVRDLFFRLKSDGVGTALDTCGFCSEDQLRAACEYADIVLYDLKDSDPARHARNVGGDLERVLDNFRTVLGIVEESRGQDRNARSVKRLWVRTPIIPGRTDSQANIEGIARFLLENSRGLVERWELCAFNNLCADKYRQLGGEWELAHSPLMDSEALRGLVEAAVRTGWPRNLVRWTGMTGDFSNHAKPRAETPAVGRC